VFRDRKRPAMEGRQNLQHLAEVGLLGESGSKVSGMEEKSGPGVASE
jgi:hypothetical protein